LEESAKAKAPRFTIIKKEKAKSHPEKEGKAKSRDEKKSEIKGVSKVEKQSFFRRIFKRTNV